MKDIKDTLINLICCLHEISIDNNEEKIKEAMIVCEHAMKYYRVPAPKQKINNDLTSIIASFKVNKSGYVSILKKTYSYLLWRNS